MRRGLAVMGSLREFIDHLAKWRPCGRHREQIRSARPRHTIYNAVGFPLTNQIRGRVSFAGNFRLRYALLDREKKNLIIWVKHILTRICYVLNYFCMIVVHLTK